MNDSTRLPLTTADLTEERREALRQLFPDVFTEGHLDIERLRMALGDFAASGPERYGLSWAGKSGAVRAVQSLSTGTLVPVPEESVNFDTTENLILEGDNLEILKLLQKSYHNKVKMIYIDPPYNTGNEFIYPDNFREGLSDYLRYSGQVDGEGLKTTTNMETDGRYHSKWLTMMYPRLFLAKKLLRDDGVIFVSIDDHEEHNLRCMMSEIFGEENFVAKLPTVMNLKGNNDQYGFAGTHEYTVVYAKNLSSKNCLLEYELEDDEQDDYDQQDEVGPYKQGATLMRTGEAGAREKRPKGYYPLFVSQDFSRVGINRYSPDDLEIFPRTLDGKEMSWRWSPQKLARDVNELIVKSTESGASFYKKQRLELSEGIRGRKPKSLFYKPTYSSGNGTAQMKLLFNAKVLDNPKPLDLIMDFLKLGFSKNDVVFDFFAGSGTVAQAVLELNVEDGGNRKFILAQLPEITSPKSTAYEAGYKTIAEITKERVRRVITRLNENSNLDYRGGVSPSSPDTQLTLPTSSPPDLGFKVFKLTSSNFKTWNAAEAPKNAEGLAESLRLYAENIVAGRSQQDIFYEILLKAGLPLTARVETIAEGQEFHSVADGALLVCLVDPIQPETLDAMRMRKPKRVICLDMAFHGNDQLKTNTVLQMKSGGIEFRTV